VIEAEDSKLVGKRVVGEINLGCGRCEYCLRGEEEHCPSRQVLGISGKNGALAEFLTLPVNNLHALPSSISDVEAIFIEPLAASLEILEQIRIKRQDSVLVLGDGKLGLLIAQVMKLRTPKVSCIGKHKRKLEILKEKAIETHLSSTKIRDKFEVVVEATGNETGLEEALSLVRPRGKVVLKSTFQGKAKVEISKIVVDEIHLIGSRCGPFLKAIEMLRKKQIEVEKLVDGDFPLDKAKEAFALAQKPGTIKVLITP
jgi:threonine dehydrogenase-like Zn-dependent dehydrogenase